MRTVIQTLSSDESYDIDVGVKIPATVLVSDSGDSMSPSVVKSAVCEAMRDDRFVKQPLIKRNCIRIFYADEDEYKHHVDVPIYRVSSNGGALVQELASEHEWIESNPTQINAWFEQLIRSLNTSKDGAGTQLRVVVRLLKRFAKSRAEWDMPSGLKLTMLCCECFVPAERLDIALKNTIGTIADRLESSQAIHNLAQADGSQDMLTRTAHDTSVIQLQQRLREAMATLSEIGQSTCTESGACEAWDAVFVPKKSFSDYAGESSPKKESLESKISVLLGGNAKTSSDGRIGREGIENKPHKFYADDPKEE